jgi:hypothetical protein
MYINISLLYQYVMSKTSESQQIIGLYCLYENNYKLHLIPIVYYFSNEKWTYKWEIKQDSIK